MDHPTSVWAAWYGLPDPWVRADAVLVARPDRVRALAECCRAAGGRMLAGRRMAGQALAVLQGAWSADPPRYAIAGMSGAAHSAAAVAEGLAACCDRFADIAASAAAAVRRCYADADAAIAAGHLLPDGPVLPLVGLSGPLIAARRQVVGELLAGVTAAQTLLDEGAAELIAGTAVDPRAPLSGMPAGRRPRPSPGAAGADRVDAGNRGALAADLRSGSARRRDFALGVRLALAGAESADQPVQLLGYDPAHPRSQGGVAIAIGDVAAADSVAVLVPGVGNSPADLSGTLGAAAGLVRAADDEAPGRSTAAVVWLGYDAPLSWPHDPQPLPAPAVADTLIALNGTDATAGGAALAAFCGSLRQWTGPSAAVTLIGHSYGSTVVSQAAARMGPDAGIDDIVLLASPGAGRGVRSAGDYRAVPADHVYVLSLPQDPVTRPAIDLAAGLLDPLGGAVRSLAGDGDGPFGTDPAVAGFGAQVIDAPSGTPAVALGGAGLAMATASVAVNLIYQHPMRNYLGGAALAPVAAVVTGRYSRVKVRRGR